MPHRKPRGNLWPARGPPSIEPGEGGRKPFRGPISDEEGTDGVAAPFRRGSKLARSTATSSTQDEELIADTEEVKETLKGRVIQQAQKTHRGQRRPKGARSPTRQPAWRISWRWGSFCRRYPSRGGGGQEKSEGQASRKTRCGL